MLQKLQKRNESGFTIIEVLIVLAIAALILLIVFLAVPALQRSARNNTRKNDASRVGTDFANFASNNNGTLAGSTPANWVNDCQTVGNAAGKLGQFGDSTSLSSWCTGTATTNNMTASNVVFSDQTGLGQGNTVTLYGPKSGDAMMYVLGATCNNFSTKTSTTIYGTYPSATVTGGNNRQSALLYTLETSSTMPTLGCISVT